MIETPVSMQVRRAEWPRDGVPEYLFSVRSAGGQTLGNGIYEYDWTLEVDSRLGLVSVETFRSDGDVAGVPVGVFRREMRDDELKEFWEDVQAVGLDRLRPAMRAHPGYTGSEYVVRQPGAGGMRVVVNDGDREVNAMISRLRHRVVELLAELYAFPERSVRLEFALENEGFVVTITNHGMEKVCFTDPRWIVANGRMGRAVVRMTELPLERPGGPAPSLRWEEWGLEPMGRRPAEEPLVTMAPGATLRLRAPVVGRDRRKRYVAYFSWANYGGEAMVNGTYRIRGRAESNRVILEGEAR
jgi:hypothetical protein